MSMVETQEIGCYRIEQGVKAKFISALVRTAPCRLVGEWTYRSAFH
jgi:hypothetical protein